MTDEIPRSKFQATLDELVDVNRRLADRSPAVRSWRRRSIVARALVAPGGKGR